MAVPNFIWPTYVRPDPGLFGRLGRMAHWLAVLMAAGIIVGSLAYMDDATWTNAFAVFCVAAGVLLAGRGVRYILAGE